MSLDNVHTFQCGDTIRRSLSLDNVSTINVIGSLNYHIIQLWWIDIIDKSKVNNCRWIQAFLLSIDRKVIVHLYLYTSVFKKTLSGNTYITDQQQLTSNSYGISQQYSNFQFTSSNIMLLHLWFILLKMNSDMVPQCIFIPTCVSTHCKLFMRSMQGKYISNTV